MNLDKLYEKYGKASVALEIAQIYFNDTKNELAKALKEAKEKVKEDVKPEVKEEKKPDTP